jgi:hypothetical protein
MEICNYYNDFLSIFFRDYGGIDFVLPTKLRFENKNASKIIPSKLDYF